MILASEKEPREITYRTYFHAKEHTRKRPILFICAKKCHQEKICVFCFAKALLEQMWWFLCVWVWLRWCKYLLCAPLKDEDECALNAVLSPCFCVLQRLFGSARFSWSCLLLMDILALIAVVVFFGSGHTSGFPWAQHCIQVVLSQGNNELSSSGMRVTTIAFGLMTLLPSISFWEAQQTANNVIKTVFMHIHVHLADYYKSRICKINLFFDKNPFWTCVVWLKVENIWLVIFQTCGQLRTKT